MVQTGIFKEKQIEFGDGGSLESVHRGYNQLVHNIAESSYIQVLPPGAAQPTDIIIWQGIDKINKVRETLITYTNGIATTVVTKQYDQSGVLITGETLTQTPTYSGGLITDIAQVLT